MQEFRQILKIYPHQSIEPRVPCRLGRTLLQAIPLALSCVVETAVSQASPKPTIQPQMILSSLSPGSSHLCFQSPEITGMGYQAWLLLFVRQGLTMEPELLIYPPHPLSCCHVLAHPLSWIHDFPFVHEFRWSNGFTVPLLPCSSVDSAFRSPFCHLYHLSQLCLLSPSCPHL